MGERHGLVAVDDEHAPTNEEHGMNLSHYEPVNPHMHHRNREKCVEACRETFPADNQAAVLALEPRKRPLGLEARDVLFHGPPTRLSGFPDSFGELGADTPLTKALAKVIGVISLIRRQHLEPFARSAAFACAHAESIQQRDDLGPFVPMRWGCARGQGHARPIGETVDKDAFAFPAIRDALTAPLARGKRSHPQRHIASESARALRPARARVLAWQPASHRLASAATTDARRSWRPIAGHAADHTSGSR